MEISHEMLFFFNFGSFLPKCTFLSLRCYFLLSPDPIKPIFSVVICVYKVHGSDVTLLFLATVAMENVYFSVSMVSV